MKLQLIDKKTLNIHGYERVENGEWRNRGVNESKDSYGNGVYRGDYMRRQYTGIEDKNGVKIHEDDIVLCDLRGDGKIQKFKIEKMTPQTRHRYGELQRVVDDNLYIEVIGNIYQNPELLEK